MEVAVVILNFNGLTFLERFLPSVMLYTPNADIYVIDNFSTDNSLAFLKSNYPAIQVIELKQNKGFAGGYNEGLQYIKSTYYVLLNSDVEVSKNWLNPLVSMAKANPKMAAIQPKILDYNNKSLFEYAGAAGGFLDIMGYAFCRGRVFDTIEDDHAQFDDSNEIFWASGACLFINAYVFHSLGGFDASFFAHMEEIDLCWRIQNTGQEIGYCSNSTIYHVGGGTLHKSNPQKTFLNYRNNLAMLFKNLPRNVLFYTLFSRMVLDGISVLKFLKNGDFRDIWAILKAHFSFYSMIPSLIKKREKSFLGYQKLYPKSIVYQYFVKQKRHFSQL